MPRRLALSALALAAAGTALLAACGGDGGRAEEQAAAVPAQSARPEPLPPPRVDPADTTWRPYSFDEVRGYPLSMETVRRWAEAERNRAALFREDPPLRRRADARVKAAFSPNSMDTGFLMAGVEEPQVAAAIGRAGISRRDWMLVTAKSSAIGMALASRQARAANPAMNAEMDRQWPGVRPFVDANAAELEGLMTGVREAWSAAGGPPAA